jgi:hypothetical protein
MVTGTRVNSIRVRVKYEEWLTIEEAESEDQALEIAYHITEEEYGRNFADYAVFDLEQEVGA